MKNNIQQLSFPYRTTVFVQLISFIHIQISNYSVKCEIPSKLLTCRLKPHKKTQNIHEVSVQVSISSAGEKNVLIVNKLTLTDSWNTLNNL